MSAELFPQALAVFARNRRTGTGMEQLLSRGHLYDLSDNPWYAFDFTEETQEYMFLPSSVTVAEIKYHREETNTIDRAVLVMHVPDIDPDAIRVYMMLTPPNDPNTVVFGVAADLVRLGQQDMWWKPAPNPGKAWVTDMTVLKSYIETLVYAAMFVLVNINTPRTQLVRQSWSKDKRHMVKGHRGAYFNGYTEVVIKDRIVSEGPAHPTGIHKCLHYVRSHLRRYKTGKITQVPEHWRGDPKLGVKDHRYRVASPPTDQASRP